MGKQVNNHPHPPGTSLGSVLSLPPANNDPVTPRPRSIQICLFLQAGDFPEQEQASIYWGTPGLRAVYPHHIGAPKGRLGLLYHVGAPRAQPRPLYPNTE